MKKIIVLIMTIMTTTFVNSKPVIAVIEFTNNTSASWWRSGVGRELSDMLSNELMGTDAFKVVERRKIQNVLSEQDLGASGRVSRSTAAKMGRLTGAQFFITGSVSAYEESGGKGGGFSFKGISLGGKKKTAYLAIDIRVINATTGEVEYVRTVEGTSKSSGMRVGLSRGGFGGNLGKEKKTPVGKAIRATLIEATDYLACVMVDKDGCEREYKNKEKKRRKKSKSSISLD